jgi:hypothetical protein
LGLIKIQHDMLNSRWRLLVMPNFLVKRREGDFAGD